MPRKADFTHEPKPGESVRRIHNTTEDIKRERDAWKERKSTSEKLKEERFAAIRARRKNRPGGSGGRNFNITVEGNKD